MRKEKLGEDLILKSKIKIKKISNNNMLTYLFTISYQSFNRTKREVLRKSVNSEVATYMRWPPLFLQSRE